MKISLLLTAFLVALACYGPAGAAGPQSITYQGYVKDGSGTPVNSQVTLTFRLYDSPSGGVPIWLESQLVTPQNGIYSVELGTGSPLNASMFGTANLYLGIQIGSDQELAPRQHITSVPFAIRADMADMAENVNSANVILDAGQITSGTIDSARLPANIAKLDASQTVTGAKIFSDQTLLLRNSSNTFSTTLQAPSATASRTISLPDTSGTAITTGNLSAVTSVGTISSGNWNGTAISPVYGGTGTNTSSAATGSLLTTTGTGTWGTLPPGNNGQVLKMTGGVPAWAADSASGVLAVANGGTGATSAIIARSNLGAAASGNNTDISSISYSGGTLSFSASGNIALAPANTVDVTGHRISSVATPVSPTDAATKGYVDTHNAKFGTNTSGGDGMGVDCLMGTVWLSAATFAAGGMLCDGRLLQISQNSALFSLLGTTFGGNGTTTFALPDLRSIAPNGLKYVICVEGIYPTRF